MRKLYSIIAVVVLACFAGSCSVEQSSAPARKQILFYKDIPGVTEEDIQAIEELKQLRTRFVYGTVLSSESYLTEAKTVGGFPNLLCLRLSELFGISIIPEAYTKEEFQSRLSSGRIDLSGELRFTPENMQQYFMTDPILQRTIKTFTNKDADDLVEIAKRRPLRCAFIQGSPLYQTVQKTWTFPFEPVFVAHGAQVPAMLKSKAVDAFIVEDPTEAAFCKYDFIHSEDYFPLLYSPVSLGTRNENLAPLIRVVQKYLEHGGFYEIAALYRQGIEQYSSHRLVVHFLTEEEKAYIKMHNTPETAVPFAPGNENYPVAFYNRETKEFQGIAIDILHQAARLSGLHFKAVTDETASRSEILAKLKTGEAAFVSELLHSKSRIGTFIWSDEPYTTDHYALLSRAEYPDVNINQVLHTKVGLIADSAYEETFHEWFPHSVNTVTYMSNGEAFDALERGEIELLMAAQNTLLNLTNYLEKPAFKANIVFPLTYGISFGFNKDQEMLRSILTKAQRQVDTKTIADSWKRKVFDYNSKMLKDMLPYMLASLVLFVVGFSAVCILLMKNRKMSKNLEQIVAQRTRELELASRAKSDFLSRMSHEMRTPMNAIIGMSLIAKSAADPVKMQNCLAQIEGSSTHLLGIINDILDFSKIEAGKLVLDEQEFILVEKLDFVVSMMMPRARERGLSIKLNIEAIEHGVIEADSLRLNQVLINLLSNAVKFSHQGQSVVLSVQETSFKNGRGVYSFAVQDTGIGISPQQAEKLFHPFEQADASVSSAYGGTGLGLVITKSIVEAMGGTITLTSEFGKGSTFHFTINVRARGVAQNMQPAASLAEEGSPVRDFSGKRALIVDDIQINRDILLELLEDTGLEMETADNGKSAIDTYQSNVSGYYDVILMDLQMPVMDGFEATRAIRASGRPDSASVPVIAMTANVMKEDVERTLAAGMNGHLGKPIDLKEVIEAIYQAVRKGVV